MNKVLDWLLSKSNSRLYSMLFAFCFGFYAYGTINLLALLALAVAVGFVVGAAEDWYEEKHENQ